MNKRCFVSIVLFLASLFYCQNLLGGSEDIVFIHRDGIGFGKTEIGKATETVQEDPFPSDNYRCEIKDISYHLDQILFTHYQANLTDNYYDLYSIDLNGENSRVDRLTEGWHIWDANFSPDDNEIAFYGRSPNGIEGIYILRQFTTDSPTVVPEINGRYPKWSSNQSLLGYTETTNFTLKFINLTNREITTVEDNVFTYVWSPQSDKIAYINGASELIIYDVASRQKSLIASRSGALKWWVRGENKLVLGQQTTGSPRSQYYYIVDLDNLDNDTLVFSHTESGPITSAVKERLGLKLYSGTSTDTATVYYSDFSFTSFSEEFKHWFQEAIIGNGIDILLGFLGISTGPFTIYDTLVEFFDTITDPLKITQVANEISEPYELPLTSGFNLDWCPESPVGAIVYLDFRALPVVLWPDYLSNHEELSLILYDISGLIPEEIEKFQLLSAEDMQSLDPRYSYMIVPKQGFKNFPLQTRPDGTKSRFLVTANSVRYDGIAYKTYEAKFNLIQDASQCKTGNLCFPVKSKGQNISIICM